MEKVMNVLFLAFKVSCKPILILRSGLTEYKQSHVGIWNALFYIVMQDM